MPNVVNPSPGQIGHGNIIIKSGQSMSPSNYAVFQSETTLETFLLANGYTAAMLKPLGYNDKVYADRIKMGLGAQA